VCRGSVTRGAWKSGALCWGLKKSDWSPQHTTPTRHPQHIPFHPDPDPALCTTDADDAEEWCSRKNLHSDPNRTTP